MVFKKDVNLKLILLLCFVIVAFAFSFGFFGFSFSNLSSDYNNKSATLEEVTARAVAFDEKSSLLSQENEQLLTDKKDLEEKYSLATSELLTLKEDKQKLALELERVNKELSVITSSYAEKEQALETLQFRFMEVENNLENANDKLSSLSKDLNSVCTKLEGNGIESEVC